MYLTNNKNKHKGKQILEAKTLLKALDHKTDSDCYQ